MKNVDNKGYELNCIGMSGEGFTIPLHERFIGAVLACEALANMHRAPKSTYMLRLFGPYGDGEWGFIMAWIIRDNGIEEHRSVTVPEPFMSGKHTNVEDK